MPTDLDNEALDVAAAGLGHQVVLEAAAQLVQLHNGVLAVLGEEGASQEASLSLEGDHEGETQQVGLLLIYFKDI